MFILDGIHIIDYISPMKSDIVRNPEQDCKIAKVYEECKQLLKQREINGNR